MTRSFAPRKNSLHIPEEQKALEKEKVSLKNIARKGMSTLDCLGILCPNPCLSLCVEKCCVGLCHPVNKYIVLKPEDMTVAKFEAMFTVKLGQDAKVEVLPLGDGSAKGALSSMALVKVTEPEEATMLRDAELPNKMAIKCAPRTFYIVHLIFLSHSLLHFSSWLWRTIIY